MFSQSSVTSVIFVSLALIVSTLQDRVLAATAIDGNPLNVVLFLVDDLGWTDLGCFGSPLYQTPNVDRLASEGVRFTNAYAPACSCSPSRAAIMTGRYPGRLGMTGIVEKYRGDQAPADARLLPATTKPFLPDDETTIAEVLQTAGYATCLVGKWHLGRSEHGPLDQGFDVAIAPPHAGAPKSYFWPAWDGNPQLPGRFDGEYLTDRLADEACEFVVQNRKRPFFLYLSFHSVHVPIEAKPAKLTKYQGLLQNRDADLSQHYNAHYASMVESMDDAVGQVLDTLDQHQLANDTLVIFFSDNGGLVHRSHRGEHTPSTSNKPLRSGKGFLYEGGIRVPLIVRWPSVATPGGVCRHVVHGCDLFPTIAEAAGIRESQLPSDKPRDGISLQPFCRQPDGQADQRRLYWHYPHFSTMGGRPSSAIREGDWKLIEHLETGRIELYELKRDIGETTDLSISHPEQAQRLREELDQWRRRMGALLPSHPNPDFQGSLGPR